MSITPNKTRTQQGVKALYKNPPAGTPTVEFKRLYVTQASKQSPVTFLDGDGNVAFTMRFDINGGIFESTLGDVYHISANFDFDEQEVEIFYSDTSQGVYQLDNTVSDVSGIQFTVKDNGTTGQLVYDDIRFRKP
jgi:hypothetical protein